MVRRPLDVLHALRVRERELRRDAVHGLGLRGREAAFGDAPLRGERLEPRALHEDAPLDESVFRENLLQFGALVCVPPVDRADGHKVVEVHSPTIIPKSAPLRGPADTVFGAGEAGRGYSYLSAMMGSSLEARIAG